MTRRDPRLAIAVFFAVAGAVLLLLVAITRFPTIFSSGREYRTVFRSVPGLTAGDEVRYGFDEAYSISQLDEIAPKLLANQSTLFYSLGCQPAWDQRVTQWMSVWTCLRGSALNSAQLRVNVTSPGGTTAAARSNTDSAG